MKFSLFKLIPLTAVFPIASVIATAGAKYANLTTITTDQGTNDLVIECWQINLSQNSARPLYGDKLGKFVNTTIFTSAVDAPGGPAATYSFVTIVSGSDVFTKMGFTLGPGDANNLLVAYTSSLNPPPTNGGTILKAPLNLAQQYTHTVPPHTVLYGGKCAGADLPGH